MLPVANRLNRCGPPQTRLDSREVGRSRTSLCFAAPVHPCTLAAPAHPCASRHLYIHVHWDSSGLRPSTLRGRRLAPALSRSAAQCSARTQVASAEPPVYRQTQRPRTGPLCLHGGGGWDSNPGSDPVPQPPENTQVNFLKTAQIAHGEKSKKNRRFWGGPENHAISID